MARAASPCDTQINVGLRPEASSAGSIVDSLDDRWLRPRQSRRPLFGVVTDCTLTATATGRRFGIGGRARHFQGSSRVSAPT